MSSRSWCSKSLLVCLVLLVALSPGLAARKAPELPPAPAGFAWQQVPRLRAAFLLPDGWSFASEKKKGTLAYFFTPEPLDRQAGFTTGLTINVVRSLGRRQSAVWYARAFIEQIAGDNEVARRWDTTFRGMPVFGCEVKLPAEEAGPPVRVHYLAIASRTTNTLYVLFFEAPEAEWDAAWQKGRVMLETFVIDEDV